jgi:uncharacterized DUF497 family protein
MFNYEWDHHKAAGNLQKHGVSFDEAVSVFADPMALTFESEHRSRTYGISRKGRLLVVVHTERRNTLRIISAGKATRYEEASPPKSNQGRPELTREQVGVGVRGKYFRPLAQPSTSRQGSHVAVLDPENHKAFPTSEAVNKALASLLALVQETRRLTARPKRSRRKREIV